VIDPTQYDRVLAEIRDGGALSAPTRRALASVAFARIAAYDADIANWFAAGTEPLPETMHISLERAQTLRYGENPHQLGARYRRVGARSWWDDAVQHGGKELSYLNLYDTEAAWRLVHRFDSPAVVIVKHANPCGVAVASSIAEAYARANACDPVSAFGGIVAANRPVSEQMASALAPVFTEVVVAPSFDEEALGLLREKKNLRLLTADRWPADMLDVRAIDGGLLVQQADRVNLDRSLWRVVTRAEPSDEQWLDLEFAWIVCAAVSRSLMRAMAGRAYPAG
jgi:phosphoribosylaminoimidazolecarboxamide formyltransferase/IMP cyclohydrolase